MTNPSVYIEATGKGLEWKVVHEGEILGNGIAKSMAAAKDGADKVLAKSAKPAV